MSEIRTPFDDLIDLFNAAADGAHQGEQLGRKLAGPEGAKVFGFLGLMSGVMTEMARQCPPVPLNVMSPRERLRARGLMR